ncbi:conjugal transfer protein [Streptomyces sp. NPDC006512]|uniref:conjugal transfer protein n=1 Tax=Streptomyces sp. NPDC006512 TaxID=3154307 RepID=UPI0033AF49E7
MTRVGLWTALAAGPLALAVALVLPRSTPAQAAPTPSVERSVQPTVDPAGAAALFVELWLRADASSTDSGAAGAVRSLAPDIELPKRPRAEGSVPSTTRTVAVRTSRTGEGWTVVVAAIADREAPAQSTPSPAGVPGATGGTPLVRYFAVPGTGGSGSSAVVISGAPAEVAAPAAGTAPASRFTHAVSSGAPLATTLAEFVRAYLGGGQSAGLERYLSPGVRVAAPSASSYARVDVEGVVADTGSAAAAVPADGTKARARVRVVGEDRAGVRWPLVYRVEVTARAGRWEVSALESGTGPAAEPAPAASPSSAAFVGGAR